VIARHLARVANRVLLPEAPAERLAAVRILVGAFALVYFSARIAHIASYTGFPAGQYQPIGLLTLFGGPPAAPLVLAVAAVTWFGVLGFTLGWRFRQTGPVAAIGLLLCLTYSSSWGQIFHTENALVLYVIVLALSRSADAYSLDARRPAPLGGDEDAPAVSSWRYGWPLRLLCLIVVATYLIAGVAKLRWGGPGWAGGTVLRDTIAADSLRKILLGSSHSPLAELFLDHTWLFRALAVLTVVVELGAPLALLHRRLALVWVVVVIGFHFGVLGLMAILFPFPMSGIAFAPFFRAERPVAWLRSRRGRPRSVPPDGDTWRRPRTPSPS
jgi:hypothetical protein